jgi:hypothetical protein
MASETNRIATSQSIMASAGAVDLNKARFVRDVGMATITVKAYKSALSSPSPPLTISRHPQNDLPTIFSPHRSLSSHSLHTNQMLTALMIDRLLLCSLVDELNQTKLGIHSLDV